MMKPVQNLIRRGKGQTVGRNRSVDQDHRETQVTRSLELCPAADAPAVFGDKQIDPVGFEQRTLVLNRKGWPTFRDQSVWHRKHCFAWIDHAQEVPVFRTSGKIHRPAPTNGQKYAARIRRQGVDCGGLVRNARPAIGFARLPGRTLKRAHRNSGGARTLDSVARHLHGKGMRRVDNMRYFFGFQVGCESVRSAETADPRRQGLRRECINATCVREHGFDTRLRQLFGQARGTGRPSQKQYTHG